MTETGGGAGGRPRSFHELVRGAEKPVLVDFWAEWCGPCRIVSPTVERLAREYSGRLLTVKVNVDRKPEIAGRYQISAIPTIIMFWRGEPVLRLQGAQPY
ncbi:MAG: thioredoxin, partial [Spirochaetales bacterium]|nr:thioredoxin [Spirochaetales bacterium]